MHRYLALIRVNFRALLSNFSGGGASKSKKKAATGIGALLLVMFLSVYLSAVYSILLGSMLAEVGMLQMLPVMMAFAAAIMSMMFTAFAASGMIFAGKDMDLMFSLPLSPFAVMLAKIMALYLENLVFCVFMMIPAGIAYLAFGGAGGVMFVLRLAICTLFLPILPTFFSLLMAFAIAWIQGRFKYKNIVLGIAYIAFFAGIMWFSFSINPMITQLAANGEAINGVFSTWLYPMGLMRDGMFGNYFALLGFIAILVLPFLALVYLFSRSYKAIVTKLTSHTTRSDYKLGSMKTSGGFAAIFFKELRRFCSTPLYLFNSGFGVIMGIGAGVACVIFKSDIKMFLQLTQLPVLPMLVLAIAFICSMICPACLSISLEGKTLWILKEAPIAPSKIFLAKLGVNAVLIWATGIITTPLLWYALELDLVSALIVLASFISMGAFISVTGICINLIFPKMDAVNDAVIIKQSLSAILGVFVPMAALGIIAVAYAMTAKYIGDAAFFAAASVLLLLLSYLLFMGISSKGNKRLQSL